MKLKVLPAALALVAHVASGEWVPMGELGQSGTAEGEKMAELSLRVASDGDGNVIFSSQWYATAKDTKVRRLSKTVPGTLFSDGKNLYSVFLWSSKARPVRFKAGALEFAGDVIALADMKGSAANFAVAPYGCTKGFCAKAKFAVLDKASCRVLGFAADGTPLGALLDYSAHAKAKLVTAVGFMAETGDLLLTTYYPEDCARRFAVDGTEVLGPMWPSKTPGTYAVADGKTWVVSSLAVEMLPSGAGRKIGFKAHGMNSIAASGGKFWLGTAQGALLFDPRHPEECITRVGGPGEVDALFLADGMVFAFVGPRICCYWLDDLPDEPLSSDDLNWMWRIGGSLYSGKVVALERQGDEVVLDFEDKGVRKKFAFGWRQVLWMKRSLRMRKADDREVVPAARPADMPQGDYTAFSVDGEWMVAYSPSRKAICKFKKR